MEKSDLPRFIENNLKRGLSIEEIKQQLLIRGFFDYDIKEALSKLNLGDFSPKKEEKKIPEKIQSIEGWDKDIPQIEEKR